MGEREADLWDKPEPLFDALVEEQMQIDAAEARYVAAEQRIRCP
jgi:hypothetical protein